MNRQDIFNTVAEHLFAQGERAMRFEYPEHEGSCVYRGKGSVSKIDGCKCAVGALIPDEIYVPLMDDGANGVRSILLRAKGSEATEWERARKSEFALPDWLLHADDDKVQLLSELQEVHDAKDSWKSAGELKWRLLRVAVRNKLNGHCLDDMYLTPVEKYVAPIIDLTVDVAEVPAVAA
jgi:hypothetical protein